MSTERLFEMIPPFFACFLIFIFWLNVAKKRTEGSYQKRSDKFWDREATANNTRKSSLDCLNYIKIPLNLFSACKASDDAVIIGCYNELNALKDLKIVNLTGMSNTDLKLQYGAANLGLLTEYDQNFTLLARLLYKIGSRFYELGSVRTAALFLEFAVECGSDISTVYKLLCKIYLENNEPSKLDTLLDNAGELNSLMKKPIIDYITSLK